MKKLSFYLDQNAVSKLARDPDWRTSGLGETLLSTAVDVFVSPVHVLDPRYRSNSRVLALQFGSPSRRAATRGTRLQYLAEIAENAEPLRGEQLGGIPCSASAVSAISA